MVSETAVSKKRADAQRRREAAAARRAKQLAENKAFLQRGGEGGGGGETVGTNGDGGGEGASTSSSLPRAPVEWRQQEIPEHWDRQCVKDGLKADLNFWQQWRPEKHWSWPRNAKPGRRVIKDFPPTPPFVLVRAEVKHGGEGLRVPGAREPIRVGGVQVYPHLGGKIITPPPAVTAAAKFLIKELGIVVGAIARVGTID